MAAYDIHTGKLRWHLGGPADQFALRQAETFFLGAPLPLMGNLYVLAEVNEEIRLMALDAPTGDLLWSQQLAMAEQGVLMDPARRLAGASPSYCEGILICPTCSGAVVAVELATRSLLWGYSYARPETVNRYSGFVFQAGPYWISQPAQRWTETAVTVAEGRVLVAPVDSDWLHCLNLIDGELLWRYRRKDDLYVAGVYQDQVVLVGRGGVRALSLSETVEQTETTSAIAQRGTRATIVKEKVSITVPKPAWDGRTVEFPEGSLPSGRGFLSGGQYFVPLSSGEVLAVDLATGELAHVSKSRESSESDAMVPGNLVCYKGKVLSQSIDGLQVFYQLASARREVERRLAARADDPAALSLRGEILLDEGKLSESIASFRRAHQLDANGRTRSLLRDALLEGLRSQFADHRRDAEEIESLLDEPRQWATYLRLMATGLQRMGQYVAAMDCYLKLVDLDQDHRDLERLGKSLSVRRDRWIQARLAELRHDAQQRSAAIDQAIEGRLEAAFELPNVAPLRRFLDYFGDHPTAAKARRELFLRLKRSDQLLEAEMVLWQQRQSPEEAYPRAAVSMDSERVNSERVNSDRVNSEGWDGPAVAELAEMLRQSKQPEDAALCYRRLGREFSDVVCLSGKTGRELLDALPDEAIRRVLRRDTEWPIGKVEVTTTSAKRQQLSIRGRYAIPFCGSPGPFFTEKTIHFDQGRRSILGYDAFGKQLFSGMLVEAASREMLPFNPSLTHVHVSGHLLLLSMSHKIMAIDTLDCSDGGGPKLLWSHDLSDPAFEAINLRRLPAQVPNLAWGMPAFRPAQHRGGTSVLGPITSGYVAFQRYRNLIAADPLTGEVLWMRHGIAPDSVLFGDNELIFAVAADEDEATVYCALDGELLGKRTIPQIEHARVLPDGARRSALASFGQTCIATLGRNILTWQLDGSRQILEAYDPWQQRPLWPPRTFSADAKICLAGHEAIGVLQRDGRFVLLALPEGRTIAEVRLEPDAYLSEIRLLRSGDQYVLVTHGPRPLLPGEDRRTTQQIPGTLCMPISFGRVYAFDLEGNPMWPKPAQIENQQLVLGQPARLPVLLFGCQIYDRARSGSARYRVSVGCIDKRTGRKVYRATFPNMSSMFEVVGDPEKDTVDLTLTQGGVTLTFTDKPVDEASEAEGEEDSAPWRRKLPKTAGALLKALERAVIGHGARRSDMDDSEHEEDPFGDASADELPAIE
ncbi:MAG: hypothetical protein A2V70_17120 [Planctomycetes bacterium RBG_13_63_9]|nr:MAG: hypothetical protein A2V70_17120 [Planctomycetes bacterium RBG_13_63_9]